MFVGLSASLATLVMVLGPLLIATAELPRLLLWLERRRIDPILHPGLQASMILPVRKADVVGLVDPNQTDRIRLADIQAALGRPTPPAPRARVGDLVLVGPYAPAETRVRPSIRETRS